MISIGMFSKMNKVTVKTLRHYDDIGLLKPARVDDFTGYRYYSTDQLVQMNKIMSMKQLGFTLKEMKQVLDGEMQAEDILLEKEREALKRIKIERERLAKIQSILKHAEGEMDMTNLDVTIKEIPEVTAASMRKRIPDYNALFSVVPNEMAPEMKRLGCKTASPAYCFNIYHDGEYRESNIDVEICEAVTEMKKDTSMLSFKKIAPVTAACTYHKGSYASIGEGYARLMKWMEDNGYEIAGSPRESFIDGIWNKEKEEEWLTEIQIPIKK
ncbi:MerR family transcriptional regulator [Bacillus marinisedimentorum]|uniref:MerR family transcriptional regulator n=1 Tax=Bacillus marinisedimentorum TaxID=1821260 RepID=UPI000873008D|nr:MerR family transcriptional regulator [Bacillus marinisedimentorum]